MLIPYLTDNAVATDATETAVEPGLPPWVDALFPPISDGWQKRGDSLCQIRHGEDLSLISLRLSAAVELPAGCLQGRTAEIYRTIAEELRRQESAYPVRLWNFIPRILAPLGSECHRYMVFNAGRFLALEECLGSVERFPCGIATASGVGHRGSDLLVHCLAASEPGEGVENPRQIPAYCYSQRFGQRPPSFARATRLRRGDDTLLLVGGTASVLGEDSAHLGDLEGQLAETLRNLSALVQCACKNSDEMDLLSRFTSLRTYYVREEDLSTISTTLGTAFSHLETIEYIQADLCRPELLVEIEGVATLS
jgi:chorismate lyase/3-hydroxybenzoate synthase